MTVGQMALRLVLTGYTDADDPELYVIARWLLAERGVIA